MRKRERELLETLLLAERDRAAADLHRVEQEEAEPQAASGGDVVRPGWAQAESASATQEQEADFITATRASAHLADVDEALRLLMEDPDALVRCQRCGADIPAARMELVPWSRLCAACSRTLAGPAEG